MPLSAQGDARPLRFGLVTVLVGLAAGVAGALLALLLHGVQHVAYGYHEGSFLAGVEAAPPGRRVAVMAVAGVVAGVGWWALYRYGRPLVSIAEAVRSPDVRMPPLTTFCHALLQIVTVGLGSPLGREVAPREVASVLAGELTRRTGLSPRQCGVLTACAAGAGLAAVYDVPLGGAVFTLEVLLGSWALGAVLPAVATAVTATVVSWAVLPDEAVYRLPQLDIGAPLLVWSVLVGPVVGVCAYWFARLAADARERAPRGRLLLIAAPAAFLVGGLLAVPYPQLLGNGKAPAEVAFEAQPALGLAAVLLALRVALVLLCLRAGARGGLLTPSLANGALLGVVAGGAWVLLWPGDSPAAYAVVGAAAFLAAAQRMPLTAVTLILEFTDAPRNLVVPVLLAVTGAMATRRLCERRRAP